MLEEMLRDRLVCGISDKHLQRRLAEPELTFARAVQIAQTHESAEANCKLLYATLPTLETVEVHSTWQTVLKQETTRPTVTCYCCGEHHLASHCQFRKVDCNNCGKRGYIAKVCKSKTKPSSSIHKTRCAQHRRATAAHGTV